MDCGEGSVPVRSAEVATKQFKSIQKGDLAAFFVPSVHQIVHKLSKNK